MLAVVAYYTYMQEITLSSTGISATDLSCVCQWGGCVQVWRERLNTAGARKISGFHKTAKDLEPLCIFEASEVPHSAEAGHKYIYRSGC